MANTKITSNVVSDDIALGGNPTTTTQSAGNNTTRIATTAFVSTAVANLADSAPAALDTLNELAAALGDDANFSTTVTNSIAAKLPLAGGTMTGNIIMGDDTSIGIADDAERIEFDGAGDINILGANLGIGTTNPASILHVDEGSDDDARIIAETHAGGDSMILFSQGASGAGSPTWGIGLDAGSGTSDGLSIGFEDTGYNDFSLTSDSKLVITTAGNVGIGTTSPDNTLHVDASGGGTIKLTRESASTTNFLRLECDGTNGAIVSKQATIFNNGDAERMRIDSTGIDVTGNVDISVGQLDLDTNYRVRWNGSNDYSIHSDANNYIRFITAGTERVRIDSSGNVGIGTTSPSAILEVVDAGAAAPGTALKVHSNQNSAAADGLVFIHSEQALAPFTALNVRQDGNGDILNLLDGTTEVFTVVNGGKVGIGTSSPAKPLSVHGNVEFRTTNTDGNEERINWNVGGASDAPSQTMYGADGATAKVHFHADGASYFTGGNLGVGDNSPAYRLELPNTASTAGQIRAQGYASYSDSRIKSNIQTLSYGLDIVKQLKPSKYKHHNSIKEDGQFIKQEEGVNEIGFIAQEVLPLMPEVVCIPEDTDKDLYSINYPKLTAVLTKAIQELTTKLEAAEARIKTLEDA